MATPYSAPPAGAGGLKVFGRDADVPLVEHSIRSRGRSRWGLVASVLAAATVACSVGPLASTEWVHPRGMFSLMTVAALACVLMATVVISLADRREMAEVGLLGTMLMAASVMPLVHGLVTPDVLFDSTEAFRASAFLTLPIAIVGGLPLLVPRSAFGRWAARRWRDWTLLSLLAVFVLASVIVFFPDLIVAPGPDDTLTIAVTVGVVLALASLSMRQMRLYDLGRQPANLVASVSLLAIAVMAVAPLIAEPYSVGSWWAHVVGALGVVGACLALAVTQRLSPSAHHVLAPVLTRDPLAAFELGLSPVVHRFVADIEAKDVITRDHVIRTGELAMRVGERFRLSGAELRDLGLAAMLHDIGKVHVPDEILKKPARLTVDEYEVMKLHPIDGESMLASEPALASAARIVRSHHERFDGRGYPDGLAGHEIPLASRIIAVCDALDAMTHDRQYRRAMPLNMAFAILREHAGSQWDEQVVEQVMATVPSMPTDNTFDHVGRYDDLERTSIPDDVGDLLLTVDAEI
jgi:HD-GYP domain-containing protein (c-di-GMP phosphodiesterase class II)